MDRPTCALCAHAPAMGKTKEVAFVGLMMPPLLALLETHVALSQRHRRTPTPLLLPLTTSEAEPEQKAVPHSLRSRLPRSGTRGRRAFARGERWESLGCQDCPWRFEAWKAEGRPCLSSYLLPTRSGDGEGGGSVQTQTHALPPSGEQLYPYATTSGSIVALL